MHLFYYLKTVNKPPSAGKVTLDQPFPLDLFFHYEIQGVCCAIARTLALELHAWHSPGFLYALSYSSHF